MHVNLRPLYDGFAIKLRYHRNEYYNHSSCLKTFGEDWSYRVIIASYQENCPRSEWPRTSIAHPGRAWAACGPTKRPTFCWWNVHLHCIKRQCCIFIKFRFAIKSTCVFSNIDILSRKYIMQWINAPPSSERKADFQFITYVSSSVCRIKTVSLISIQFTGIDHLHTLYTSTNIYTNWMSTSS